MPPKKKRKTSKKKTPKRITKNFNGVEYEAVGRTKKKSLATSVVKKYKAAGLTARSTKMGDAGYVIWVKRPKAKKKRKKAKKKRK